MPATGWWATLSWLCAWTVTIVAHADRNSARAVVHRHQTGHTSQAPWRGNRFIARDGILPYQRCGANASDAAALPLHAQYSVDQKFFNLVIVAASVWGKNRRSGHAPSIETIEFLAFDALHDSPCPLDAGNHCMTAMNATQAEAVGEVRCAFDFGDGHPTQAVTAAGSIRPPLKEGRNAFVIACPLPGGRLSASNVPDQWQVTLSMVGAVVPIDICYDHVQAPVEVTMCMETAYGYSRHSPFWAGSPRFAGNHTLVDAALTYHTAMMGAHVRFNDIDDDASDAVLPYTRDGQVSYRSGWRLASRISVRTDFIAKKLGISEAGADAVAFEVLVDAACHWEFRYRAKWTMMISSVDNFAAPLEAVSLVEALQRAPIDNVSTILVPTVEGFSMAGSLTAGPNILLRYPIAGPDLAFNDTRHTPIFNPRHLDFSWIHWAREFRPHVRLRRQTWGPEETLTQLRVHALHLMSLTRPERDQASPRQVADPLFWERGLALQAHLDRRMSGHL